MNTTSPVLLLTGSYGGQSLYYGTQISFFEQTGDGYDGFYISEELVNQFTTTDIRSPFFEYNVPGAPDRYATNKFGIDDSSYELTLLNGETVKQKTINFNESIIMMRVAEMYLVEAEAILYLHLERPLWPLFLCSVACPAGRAIRFKPCCAAGFPLLSLTRQSTQKNTVVCCNKKAARGSCLCKCFASC